MKFAMVLTLIILNLAHLNCVTKNTDMNQNMLEIRQIFKEDKSDIIKKYGATGAGIGKRDGVIVFVVYVDPKTLPHPLDEHWKNVPLVFENIGDVKLQ